jgi:hypothetical protein
VRLRLKPNVAKIIEGNVIQIISKYPIHPIAVPPLDAAGRKA